MYKYNSFNVMTFLMLVSTLLICGDVHSGQQINKKSKNSGASSPASALVKTLLSRHFIKKDINNEFSQAFHGALIARLDPNKIVFLASDIEVMKVSEKKLDNELRSGKITTAKEMFYRFIDGEILRLNYIIAFIEGGGEKLSFDTLDEYLIDRSSMPFAITNSEREGLWLKQLKWEMLNQIAYGQPYEKVINAKLNGYKHVLNKVESMDNDLVNGIIFNVITHLFDSHSDYWPPSVTKSFNTSAALSLDSIGAVLWETEGYIEIVRVVVGGAADRNGGLSPGDRIIAVGEGNDAKLVDVFGLGLDEVVELLKGPKRSVVVLEVLSGLQRKTLSLERDRVVLDDQGVQNRILSVATKEGGYKVGVISVPAFYVDYEAQRSRKPHYKSSANDVSDAVKKLMEDKVDGIIIDLRNNGGGSLAEAVNMTNLFIDKGLVVQIRDSKGRVNRHNWSRSKAIYRGPLAIMTNRLSAGASEIFAGAMQDYQRGIVVGSQSFGRGTVQSVNPLPVGGVMITESIFYRVNGDSFQIKGVTPDIQFPSIYDHNQFGESAIVDALDWDKIKPASFSPFSDLQSHIPQLQSQYSARMKNSPEFKLLQARIDMLVGKTHSNVVILNKELRKKSIDDYVKNILKFEGGRDDALEGLLLETVKILSDYSQLQ